MAFLRAKERNQRETATSLVEALPNELLVDIVGKISTISMADSCKIKLSCNDFLNSSVDHYVYQHVSLDKFALIPHSWFTDEKETMFLRRCRESGVIWKSIFTVKEWCIIFVLLWRIWDLRI
jgi:hypothetical protein